MKRAAFVAGTAAALASGTRAARAQTIAVADLVEAFPGVVGIVTRTLVPSADPVVAVRADEHFPSASIIKLGIMLTVFKAYDEHATTPGKEVTLLPGDIVAGNPVLGDAHSGQRWQIGDLLEAMIVYSDNTASNGLISAFGFRAINHAMRSAGMTRTVLARHFADVVPPGRTNLNVTTPADVARLLYHIERGAHEGIPTVASPSSCRAMVQLMLKQAYREMIPAGVKRKVPIANKTGELDYVRNDAAIVDPLGDAPYIEVILTKDLEYPGLAYGEIARIATRIDAGMQKLQKLAKS